MTDSDSRPTIRPIAFMPLIMTTPRPLQTEPHERFPVAPERFADSPEQHFHFDPLRGCNESWPPVKPGEKVRFAFAAGGPNESQCYRGAMEALSPQTLKDIADRLAQTHAEVEGIDDIVQRMGGIKWCQNYYSKDSEGVIASDIQGK